MTDEKKNEGEHLIPGRIIDVKAATEIAVNYLVNIVGLVRDIRIEEVEKNEVAQCWVITLGYLNQTDAFMAQTKYKTFKISTVNGEVLSMKIKTME